MMQLHWSRAGSELDETGTTSLIADSGMTVITPPPYVINYSKQYIMRWTHKENAQKL